MSLSVTESGSGPPLLLVHAGGVDRRMWGPLTERLADTFTVIAPDLRGHGRTPAAAGLFRHADDLLAVLDERGIERAAVVAAAFGGGIALGLAARAPGRVTSLALLAGPLFDHPMGDAIEAFWEQEETRLGHADIEGAVELGIEFWVREPAVADLVRSMTRDAFLAQLPGAGEAGDEPAPLAEVRCPVLAVSGGRDQPVFAEMADRICAEAPDARRAEVPDAGHLIALERPEETAALLLGFLAENR